MSLLSLFLCVEVRLGLGGYEGLGDKWFDVMFFYPTQTYYVEGTGSSEEYTQYVADLLPTPGIIHLSYTDDGTEPIINQDFENIPKDTKIDFLTSVYIRKDVSIWDERVNIKPHTETEAKQIMANAIEELNNLAKNKLNN